MKTLLTAFVLFALAACGLPTDAQGNDVDHDSRTCSAASEPAACPGGGAPSCEKGKWECCDPALGCGSSSTTTASSASSSSGGSTTCDPSTQPAACPGGVASQCEGGTWVCCDPALGCNGTSSTGGSTGGTGSSGTCDPSTQPAACPGGVASQCESGTWVCCDPALGCGGSTTTGGSTGGTGGGNGTCGQASDCTGILPQTCEICADGNQDCDHWDCVSSACQISICENDGGPGSN